MPSLRNVVQRRNHKERGQIASREKFGLLEKKKDYLLRAKDYHSKQNRLKALKEKALFRNPDEFYFKMINTETKGGVHIQKRNEELPDEMVQLLKSQDKEYIKHQRDLNEGDELPKKKKSKHIVFVDSEKEAKEFSPVKHLDTLPELVNRKFNRPRMDTLKKSDILATHSGKELKEIKKEREMKFKELASRMKREEEMQRAEQELTLQRALRQKGRKKVVGKDKHGLDVYKWQQERKK
ncbi:hypothetical protein G6F56_003559 [Rhizopus delemar]|nr:hypothetical protein G6F56_003559 [Rhizopus delemar]